MYVSFQPVPLNPWGDFLGRRRLSESPYVESVWEGIASSGGTHLTAADGTIDLTFLTRRGSARLIISGPTSKVCPTSFEAGDEVLAVKLRPGVHFPYIAERKIVDLNMFLPIAGKQRFGLHSSSFARPDFDTVEAFAERLAKTHVLERDIVVEDVLAERLRPATGLRTIQRHFIKATGLTMSHVCQIRRAEKARGMLSRESLLTTIAYEAGYSNPGHMTNAFKYFFGQSPSTIRTLMRR